MPDTNLLPCPFCGSKPKIDRLHGVGSIQCECSIEPSTPYCAVEHAIAIWNTRALTPKQKAAEEMFEALEHITEEMALADFDPNDTDTWYGRALAILAKAGQQ